MNNSRKIQIGVIGSCTDLNYSNEASQFSRQLGRTLANRGYILVYGAEKDINSLPTEAAMAAKTAGGTTVGVTYEKGIDLFNKQAASIVIASGLVRGGGRETTLMLSCDVVIAIAGGSGTLNEVCVAYQANIPVIAVPLFGGWSRNLANTYLDDRKRYKILEATSVNQIVSQITNFTDGNNNA